MSTDTFEATRQAMLSTAQLYRLGMSAQASDALVSIVDGLCDLLTDASFLDADAIGPVLHHLVQAQERGDAIRIADLLEFELHPRMSTPIELRRAG